MDMTLVNPFVTAALHVLRGEIGEPVARGELRLVEAALTNDDVTTLIGLAGEVTGVIMLSMSMLTAAKVAEQMVGYEPEGLDELSRSAIAELANMISGRASMDLERAGLPCNLSAPTVVIGAGATIAMTNVQRICVQMQTVCGDLMLHIGVREK